MTLETGDTKINEMLSRKSDTLSDYDRNIKVEEIKKEFIYIINKVCKFHKQDWVVIPCGCDNRKESVSDIYFSRLNNKYEICLNHPFFRESVSFRKGDSNFTFELTPKESRKSKMLFSYEKHPETTFDGLINIFSFAYSKIERVKEEFEE